MSLAKLTSISTKTLSLLLERQRLQTLPAFAPAAPPTSPLHDSSNVNAANSTASSTHHLAQIKKNLEQLRAGILAMQAKDGDSEAVGLLKNQYERMRGMLGSDAAGVPSLLSQTNSPDSSNSNSSSSTPSISSSPSPAPSPVPRQPLPSIGLSGGSSGASKQAALFLSSSTSSSHARTDSAGGFAPYKDDPSLQSHPITSPSHYNSKTSDDVDLEETGALLQSQRFLMSEQDQRLDELSHSINRQHHLSVQINDELEVHHGLLEELDTGIDRTAYRLGSARRRLDKVARGIKENSSAFMIGLLIFVLLILIIVLKT